MPKMSVLCRFRNPRYEQWWRIYIVFVFISIMRNWSEAQTCNEPCLTCGPGGKCTSCVDGYYQYTGQTCAPCPISGCLTCSDALTCTSCKPGKFGTSCANQCSTGCQNNTCDFLKGTCSCIDGNYNLYCSAKCSEHCTNTCNKGNGSCQCKIGYSGDTCHSKCFSGCLDCNSTACLACQPGKHGQLCQLHCETDCPATCDIITGNCKTCPANCVACDSLNEKCYGCLSGYYGKVCEDKCPSQCSANCDPYNGQCVNNCPSTSHCMGNCNSTGHCFQCDAEYYGVYCEIRCPAKCDGQCERLSGECFKCRPGYYGRICSSICPGLCLTGCDNLSGACSSCSTDRCGQNCQFTYSTNCVNNVCMSSSKPCVLCKSGFHGDFCNGACPAMCYTCLNGTHCTQCKRGYYDQMCQNTCPNTCVNLTCEIHSGACHTCINNTVYGGSCNMSCSSKCNYNECLPDNGACTRGCIPGYYGVLCDQKCPEMCSKSTENTTASCDIDVNCIDGCVKGFKGLKCAVNVTVIDEAASRSDPPVAIIAGAAGGGSALIILIVVVVVVLKMRRKAASDLHPGHSNDYHTVDEIEKPVANKDVSASEMPSTTNNSRSNKIERQSKNQCDVPKSNTSADTDESVLEIDDDDRRILAKHQGNPNKHAQQEENVYYIGLEDIKKRKIAVDQLMDFVSSKPFEYFEEEFEKFPYGLTRSYNVARQEENLVKNRYQGIYAYDETRVKIKGGDSDYINANYIDGYEKRNAYIASLGPMSKQMGDFSVFWTMIWQQKVETVVMVTNLDEEGKKKCEKYWPDLGAKKVYGHVSVEMLTEDVYAEFTRRTFKITSGSKMDGRKGPKGSSTRTLHHLHFTAWPDRGIPEDVTAILELRHRVLTIPTKLDGPTLVHCSAGIGRTGTYIALDILIHEGEAERAVEIHGCVLNMRRNRVNMVQTAEQYQFLHAALAHALTMDSAPISADKFRQQASMEQVTKQKLFKQLLSVANHFTNDEMKTLNRNKTLSNKNREGADIPGDEHRPRLYLRGRSETSDYINAVYMDSLKVRRRYILAQSPLPGTVQDFLTLVFQEDCMVIVSLDDRMTDKVGVFYPADNQVLKVGDFEVTTQKKDDKTDSCVIRQLSIKYKKDGSEKALTHIQYTDWPQSSPVPTSPASFIHFIQFVEQQTCASTGTIVLHCLDGASKCGLFCTVSYLLEKMGLEQEASVVNEVRRVQTRRRKAIASMEQFNFCYECVLQYIGSFNTYSNFGMN